MKKQLFTLLMAALLCLGCTEKKTIQIVDTEVEGFSAGEGIDIPNPRFCWQITSDQNNVRQTAYQITVALSEKDLRSDKNLVWNSGKTETSKSVYIPFEGTKLKSNTDYFWQVKVWTNKGETVSKVSKWSTAFFDQDCWKAKWIGLDSLANKGDSLKNYTRLAARYLRKEFPTEGNIKRAKMYICGLGLYECYINGKKIGNDVLKPACTDYLKTVFYNVYDVTSELKKHNTVGVALGNGRFVPFRVPDHEALSKRISIFRNFGFPKLLFQLEIEYNDGRKSTIVSDDSWKLTTLGPIVSNNEYDGEEYDANLEITGWNQNGFNDSGWMQARSVEAPAGKLFAQTIPNIAVMERIKPIAIKETAPGKYVLDMGQNMVGVLSMNLKGKKDRPVVLTCSEALKADGTIENSNYRTARSKMVYTPAKDGAFSYTPVFSYFGFRFVEITGLDYKPELGDFTGEVWYDEMETTGGFNSSNKTLNQIFKNAYWGIRGNYRSGPTDCPQRDEKLFWLGDRSTNCFGESFIFDNHLLYTKWLQDMEDEQLPSGCMADIAPFYWYFDYDNWKETYWSDNVTWPSTFMFASKMLYEQYGDERPIKKHYPAMVRWINYMVDRVMENDIIYKDRYGDWCVPPESPELIHSKDPARKTEGAILSTTTMYNVLHLMAQFAEICGHKQDIPHYMELAAKMKTSYNNLFFDKEKGCYGNNTATANLLSLMQGLVPDGYEQRVFDNIVHKIEIENNSHVCVGILGIQYQQRGLTKYGRSDLAYRLATNNDYPSYGYMIENGATTIWELWNGNTGDPEMNSHNHVMLLGDLIIWYYEQLAGIKSDRKEPGFKKIIMNPIFPEELDFVGAYHKSPYGMIKSNWKKENGGLIWDIEIPCNSSAEVEIPLFDESQPICNGKPISEIEGVCLIEKKEKSFVFLLPSGKYRIESRK